MRFSCSREGIVQACVGLPTVDQALGEGAEFQLVEDLAQGLQIDGFAAQFVGLEGDGYICYDGGQPFGHADLIGVLDDFLLLSALELIGVGEQILDGTELLDEFLGILGAHARATGDVVGGVAHQAQDVDELFGRLDAVFGIDLLDAQNLFLERVIDLDVGGHQLPEVLVSRDHIGEKSLLLGLVGEGTDDIIGLIALNFKDGDAVGLQNAFDVGDSHEDAFGRLFAVGLVGFVILVPEGLAARRVKAHGDV